jgi:hypothetical protein
MIVDGLDKSRSSGNNLFDDGDNDSDGHDFLHSFFSAEMDKGSTDTEWSFEDNPTRLDKKLAEETDFISERLRAGDSLGENSVFSISSIVFLLTADIPIILGSDVSAVDISESVIPSCPEREQETYKGFDERISFSLSGPWQTDAVNINNRHNDGIEKTTD